MREWVFQILQQGLLPVGLQLIQIFIQLVQATGGGQQFQLLGGRAELAVGHTGVLNSVGSSSAEQLFRPLSASSKPVTDWLASTENARQHPQRQQTVVGGARCASFFGDASRALLWLAMSGGDIILLESGERLASVPEDGGGTFRRAVLRQFVEQALRVASACLTQS